MGFDHERGKSKRRELAELVSARLAAMPAIGITSPPDSSIAERLVDAFCSITPPEQPEMVMDLVVIGMGGGRGGRTRKLGNLALNMRKLVATAAAGTLGVIGMVASPWTAPLAALVLWDSLWSKMEVDIQEREASVLWAMWLNRDEKNNRIPQDGLLASVNAEREKHGRVFLSQLELEDALAMLLRLGCVEKDDLTWWLREWVQVNFE